MRSLSNFVLGFQISEKIQTRGINPRRRSGENTKTVETKAAATGAKNALIAGSFMLCSVACCFLILVANYRINFYLCKKKCHLNCTFV
jgi:hypothetical protein